MMLGWGSHTAPAVAQSYSPQEAVKHMTVPPGFQVQLVASEPEVRKPVTMTFDGRGRMWVIQYLQYPNPNGLKPVKVDQYLRTTYDRVPEPPPRGPKGADRITIFYDPDDTGKYRKSKDFVGNLNLASGMALGYGGVFVLQAPYLLFYPDRNGDDVPDGDPAVLLTGFGMEDAHAVANSLQWGPDGWLYGAQGSTVTAHIRGLEFQQGIWRYHPITREFELFAEGGGNTWGLDFDAHGNAIAGTNWGNSAMLHQVQGGYYVKGFAKHGPLHNPFTFGYFEHVPYKGFKGGHVTCGGIIYQGGSFPKEFENTYIAGNLLSNSLYWHVLEPKRSSFSAHFGGDFLIGNDNTFRPVDCLVGPDGALYIADWCDKRANHVDPINNWDRSRGRVYRVQYVGNSDKSHDGVAVNKIARHSVTANYNSVDLNKLPTPEVVGLLSHPNEWYRREANRILAERRDPAVVPTLRKMVSGSKPGALAKGPENDDRLAMESLWALYVSGGFDEATAAECLRHPLADVRAWTIRFLGDSPRPSLAHAGRSGLSSTILASLLEIARTEKSPSVRSQLASTCKRLPGHYALPIVRELLRRQEDVDDAHIPLLLWWAIEDKALSDRDQMLDWFRESDAWQTPLIRRYIVERLARRYMAEGGPGYAACARLLSLAPSADDTNLIVQGMEKALEGKQLSSLPKELEKPLQELWGERPTPILVRLALRLGSGEAYELALQMILDPKERDQDRAGVIEALGQIGSPGCIPRLEKILSDSKSNTLRLAALGALEAFPDARVSNFVLSLYPTFSGETRSRAQTFLLSRPASALELLQNVDRGKIRPQDVPLDSIRRVVLYDNAEIKKLVAKHWGQVSAPPPGAKVARINSVLHLLGQAKGDPAAGKALFQKHCATCHTIFGEGNKIGPDLTSADRQNRSFLVTSMVDPSAIIRPEFMAHTVTTTDGRALHGIIVDRSGGAITLVDSKTDRTVLAESKIESLEPSPISLMPESILDPLDDQQIRDLVSYIQTGGNATPAAPVISRGRKPTDKEEKPLQVCLVSGSLEYDSDHSLAGFEEFLEKHYRVKCSRAFRKADNDLPGLENLKTCDVLLLFTRRLTIDGEQLEQVKKYCQAGKPIVGVRTASHAFQNWLALDKEILGGNYQGHYGSGPAVEVHIENHAKDHPTLMNVKPFWSAGSLYKNTGLAKGAEVLLTGSIPEHTEPVAWTHLSHGGRVFYTSLGHSKDFADDNFKQLLVNALFWTANRPIAKR
ncbi:MAG TPA: PVC-type heme-binding CxxCH protein [Gemmataceae bacterium]|nr:PVC-type heme-binding CxxCH protein [Gemmataceae bacterium]